jgi:Flp pilus assembly protein TadD
MEPAATHKFKYSDGTDPLLLAARDNISNGNLPGAMHAYQHLIRHDRMVKELLPDLAQLVQANPRDPLVWETLGDALAREGDMVHARQSYDKARKLRQ